MAIPHDNPGGEAVPCEVTAVESGESQNAWQLIFDNENGETLELTACEGHPFYVDGKGWVDVQDLETGDVVVTADGAAFTLQEKLQVEEEIRTWSLTVDGNHTFFVGDGDGDWVLVHNSCPSCTGIGHIPITTANTTGPPYWNYKWEALTSKPCPRCQYNIGAIVDYMWSRTPGKVEIKSDKTAKVTLDRNENEGAIYIIYGHGGMNPHEIVCEKRDYIATCFVGCHPGITNAAIPELQRLSGANMTNEKLVLGGLTTNPEHTAYWKEKAFEEAKAQATKWLYDNPGLTRVVIYTKNIELYRKIDIERAAWPPEQGIIIDRQ